MKFDKDRLFLVNIPNRFLPCTPRFHHYFRIALSGMRQRRRWIISKTNNIFSPEQPSLIGLTKKENDSGEISKKNRNKKMGERKGAVALHCRPRSAIHVRGPQAWGSLARRVRPVTRLPCARDCVRTHTQPSFSPNSSVWYLLPPLPLAPYCPGFILPLTSTNFIFSKVGDF